MGAMSSSTGRPAAHSAALGGRVPPWWLDGLWLVRLRAGLSRAGGVRASRDTVASALLTAAVAYVFYRLGAGRAGAGVSALVPVLFVYQFCVFVSVLPQRRSAAFFVDPPGPVLPYRARHLVVYWYARIVAPVGAALGVAYLGVAAGLADLSVLAATGALAADVATLATVTLAFGALRWHFRTFAPFRLRLALAAGSRALLKPILTLALAAGLAVAIQVSVTGVFATAGVTRALQGFVADVRDGAAVDIPWARAAALGRERHLLVLGPLITGQRRGVTTLEIGTRAVGLVALLPLFVLPARRREEPWDVNAVGHRYADRLADASVAPLSGAWRVAGRLVLPYLGEVFFFTLANVAITFVTAAALVMAGPGLGEIAATQLRLSYFGYILAGLTGVSLMPLVRRLGVTTEAYAHLCTLPVPLASLVTRLVGLSLSVSAALQIVVVGTWARLMLSGPHVALMFTGGMIVLVTGALAGAVWVQAVLWTRPRPVRRVAAGAWTFGSAGAMMGHYAVARFDPSMLTRLLFVETLVSLMLLAVMMVGVHSMVARREPMGGAGAVRGG